MTFGHFMSMTAIVLAFCLGSLNSCHCVLVKVRMPH
ncbi:uncharacterized protein LOC108091589 [Drosophila ficusphila]|nr:uncharacterized protein LOC108091589 [Drosophila ficusphila]